MAYRVKINGVVAIVDKGVWRSSNSSYESILNNWLQIKRLESTTPESPFFWLNSPATPDPDWLIANAIAQDFDGTVMDEPLPSAPLVVDGEEVDESEIIY